MRKKYGKFYADWKDEHGHRRMKACATKGAAEKFTRKMRREVASKKAQAPRRSRKSSAPTRRATPRRTRAAKRASGSSTP